MLKTAPTHHASQLARKLSLRRNPSSANRIEVFRTLSTTPCRQPDPTTRYWVFEDKSVLMVRDYGSMGIYWISDEGINEFKLPRSELKCRPIDPTRGW